jgi:LysR family transcriptional activator of glutamate synthase operon
MTLIQLQYFQKLAGNEHLLKTADELHVSASTLSASLKNLEEELGAPLFNRIGRNIVLNDKGKVFLHYVESMMEDLDKAKEAMRSSETAPDSVIAISLNDAAFYYGLLMSFIRHHPNYSFRQIEEDPKPDGKLIFQKKLKLMVTAVPVRNAQLDSLIVNKDPYVLVVAKDHPLAQKKTCSLRDLENETLLCRSADSYFEQCVRALCLREGYRPARRMEFSYPLRSRMVNKGLGVAISTELSLPSDFYQDMRALHIEEFMDDRYIVRAYWRRDQKLSEPAAEFRDFMVTHLEKNRNWIIQRLISQDVYIK